MRLLSFDRIDSTNNWAKKHLSQLLLETTCIIAREQTAGRGRCGRSWIGFPDRTLALSFVEPVRAGLSLLHYLQVSALFLHDVVSSFGISARVRWPNDIWVGDRKLAGILVEGVFREGAPWVIVGIGMNVDLTEEMVASFSRPVISLRQILGYRVSMDEIQQAVIERGLKRLSWAQENPVLVSREWVQACRWMVGSPALPHKNGVIEGISEDGALFVRMCSGQLVSVYHGE